MIYLEQFLLPTIDDEDEILENKKNSNGNGEKCGYIDNGYPCGLFSAKKLTRVDFENITIFYGGNGSGKSTLLNLIANKLQIKRIAPYNSSEMFNLYVKKCGLKFGRDDEGYKYRFAPHNSRIITSDDIFDYMLTVRDNNQEVAAESEEWKKHAYGELRYGETVKLEGIDDYDKFRLQVMSRQKSLSRRKFIQKIAGKEVKLHSNGETALEYFERRLANDCLFCLDEPENSLSPKFQQELVKIIEDKARYCGCQFVIATHSPFVLAINGAKIYDLDATPVDVKKWWKLENTKTYFEFFEKYRDLFLNHEDF